MLLIRDHPLLGESLSSFRQRLWMKNGHWLFPVFKPELRRSDPDLQNNDCVVQIISNLTGLSKVELLKTSLRSHPLIASQSLPKRNKTIRWASLLKYSRSNIGSGSAACPLCLKEDISPYFRFSWRLSSVVACKIHGSLLVDKCPQCHFPTWPYAAAKSITLFNKHLEMDQCPRCLFRLRDANCPSVVDSNLLNCARICSIENSFSVLGHETRLIEHFSALRGVLNLAIRQRSRRKLIHNSEFLLPVDLLGGTSSAHTSFDRLSLEQRAALLSVTWPLLRDWPSRFLDFAQETGVRLVDFSEDLHDLPNWFVAVLEQKLSRPGRTVTPESVENAIRWLHAEGQPVNKERVGRLVGSREVRPVIERLGRRKNATELELRALIDGLRRYIQSGSARRMTSIMVRSRNTVVVVASILRHCSFDQAITLSEFEVQKLVQGAGNESLAVTELRYLLKDALMSAEKFKALRHSKNALSPLFVAHRGTRLNFRGPRDAFCEAMRELDQRLWRNPSIFFI